MYLVQHIDLSMFGPMRAAIDLVMWVTDTVTVSANHSKKQSALNNPKNMT